MGLSRSSRIRRSSRCLASATALCLVAALGGTGCSSPSAANIALRKENADLRSQIDELKRLRDADHARIRGLQERVGTLPTLPQDRLEDLVTVGSISVTRLTSGFDENRSGGADTGVRAYVRLFDTAGDVIKAAGTFTVEVFDLAEPDRPLVAKRVFSADEARQFWVPSALIYSFVLPVPWIDGRPPSHEELTVKVTYVDGLTQRAFTEQRVIHVKLRAPAATRPTTGTAAS